MNQINYDAKINELEQMVKSMTDQQNLHNKNGNKKEKDYNDDLFSVSNMSRSVKPIGIPDNKSMFSFAQNEHHNNNQTIPEPHNWHDDDNNSQMMAKEILRKGSGIFDRQNAKENDMLAGNFAGEGGTRKADRACSAPHSSRVASPRACRVAWVVMFW